MARFISAIKANEKFILIALMLFGLLIASWPLAEIGYARWNQYALRAAFAAPTMQTISEQSKSRAGKKPARQNKTDKKLASATHKNKAKSRNKTKSKSKVPARWEPVELLIPEIDLDAIVVSGIDTAALRRGPGHDPASEFPGQRGNCVIAAHRNAYGWWFRRLDELEAGSLIRLQSAHSAYTYVVTDSMTVSEWDLTVLSDPASDVPRLTLYSCTLPKSQRRLVIWADLMSTDDLVSQ